MSSISAHANRQRRLSTLLVKSAFASFAVKTMGMGLAFGLQVMLARFLGADQYGVYIYAITWLTALLLLATHGWDTATIRYVAAYRAKAQWNLFRGFLNVSRRRPVYAAIGIGVAVTLTAIALRDRIGGELSTVLLIGVYVLPINALLRLTEAGIQGLKRVAVAQIPQQIVRPILFTVSFAVAFIGLDITPAATHVMALNIVSALVVLIVANKLFRSSTPADVYSIAPEFRRKEWVRTALPLLLVSGFIMLMNRLDILMLGAMVGTSEAGVYSVAGRVAELSAFGLIAVNAIMAPLISDLYATGKLRELQRLVSQSTIGVAGFALVVGTILVVFAEDLLRIFGSEFTIASDSLVILIAAQVISALAGSVGFIITMTGQQRTAAIILGTSAFINALLNILLIPRYGMEGAAVATATTMVIWNILMVIVVRRKLGIFPTVFAASRAFR